MCVKNQGKQKTERRDTKAFNDVLFIAVEITIAIIQLSVLIVSWATPSLVSFRGLIQDSEGQPLTFHMGGFREFSVRYPATSKRKQLCVANRAMAIEQ